MSSKEILGVPAVAAPIEPGQPSPSAWSIWPHRIRPPHKQVVAIVPGRGATPGALIVSSDDVPASALDEHARLIVAVPAMKEALEGIANHPACLYPHPTSSPYLIGVADGHRLAAKIARAALALLSTKGI